MEVVLDNRFAKTRENIYEELKSRTDNVILNSMKGYLREKGIPFDSSDVELKKFKTKVIKKLDSQTQLEIAGLENRLNKELDTVIEDLKNGSQTAFSNFTQKLVGIGKSTTEMIARGTAIRTAYILDPGIGTVALGTSIAVPAVVRTVKSIKTKTNDDYQAALDVMILKLTTKVESGIATFEVSPTIMNTISENLSVRGIKINPKDSALFVRDILNLDNAKKESIIRAINNMKGNPFDIDKELKDVKLNLNTIKNAVEKNIVAPISTAAMIGLTTAGTLNDVAGDAVPSIITALGVGATTGNMTAAIGAAGTQYGVSKFASAIPVIGPIIADGIKKVNSIETTAATTGAIVAGTIAIKVIPGLVFTGGKGIYRKIKNLKDAKDGKVALENNVAVAIKKSKEEAEVEKSRRSDKDIVLDIVRDTLISRGIVLPKNIDTSEELKSFLRGLDNDDKREVYKIATTLENVKKESNRGLRETLTDVAKTAYWGGVIALAGLGVYDIFINPGFLDGLKNSNAMKQQLAQEGIEAPQEASDIIEVPKNKKIVINKDGKYEFKPIRKYPFDPSEETIEVDPYMDNIINEYASEIKTSSNIKAAVEFDPNGEIHIFSDISCEELCELIVTERKLQAHKALEETVHQLRDYLPDSEVEGITIAKHKDSFLGTELIGNRAISARLGLDTEEGLKEFLKSINEDSEALKKLCELCGAKDVEKLTRNPYMRFSINLFSNSEGYSTTECLGINQLTDFNFISRSADEAADTIADLVNERMSASIGNMPTSNASTNDVVEYFKEISSDPKRLKDLEIFMEATNRERGNFFAETWKDLSNNILHSDELIYEPSEKVLQLERKEVEEFAKKLSKEIAQQDELKEAYKVALTSKTTSDPMDIVQKGAVVGTGIGVVNEIQKRKGIISRIKANIADKVFPAKKGKPIIIPNNVKSEKEELNIKIDVEDLKPTESIAKRNQESEMEK